MKILIVNTAGKEDTVLAEYDENNVKSISFCEKGEETCVLVYLDDKEKPDIYCGEIQVKFKDINNQDISLEQVVEDWDEDYDDPYDNLTDEEYKEIWEDLQADEAIEEIKNLQGYQP